MEFDNRQPGSSQHSSNGAVVWLAPGRHGAPVQPEVPLTNPVVTATQLETRSGPPEYGSKYSRVSSLFFGLVQILLALLSVAGAAFVIEFEATGAELGTGFWCGLVYGVAGCLATVACGCPINSLIIAVAVLSFLCVPFGIAGMVLGIIGVANDVECNDESCITRSPFAVAGNAVISTTGFYEILFGICLFAISIRAIHKSSTAQVATVTQVHYSTNSPESVQINNTADNQQVASNVYTQNQQQQQFWTTQQPNVYAVQEQQCY